jgi:hypothetical protein
MKENKKVVFRGSLKNEVMVFNEDTGEIVFRVDVIYKGLEYKNIPILRLTIDADNEDAFVDDNYMLLLPYLKPIKAFREVLEASLLSLCNHESAVIRVGAESYLREIKTFSEVKSLVRQAKGCINNLKPEKKESEFLARKVLEVMNVTPSTDIEFSVE